MTVKNKNILLEECFKSHISCTCLKQSCLFIIEGKKHDSGMLDDSGLLTSLEQFAFSPTGQPMCISGDPAYSLRVHLQCLFRNGILTPQMTAYNKAMSAVRVSVEWLFGDIINFFKFTDFKKNLKVMLSSAGKLYIVCALLHNAMTCLYGNQTSTYFNLEPQHCSSIFNSLHFTCLNKLINKDFNFNGLSSLIIMKFLVFHV